MSLFNKRKLNILNALETTKKVLFSLLLIIFSLTFIFSTAVFANLQNPNDFDNDGIPNSIDASPGTQDPFAGVTNFNTLSNNINTNAGSGGTAETETTYTPLAPLPGLEGEYDTTGSCPLGKYLTIMINLILGIAAVLAMVMIVSGGIQYMGSELISSKEAGKGQIKNAILGLLLALGAYLILNTINPSLLKICLNEIPKISLQGPAPEGNTPFQTAISGSVLESGNSDISCPGTGGQNALASIANSFIGDVTYSQSLRGTYNPSIPTVYLDCSSFVKQVYQCAGLNFSGDRTANMFPGTETMNAGSITGNGTIVNGQALEIGDLLGWMPGESSVYSSGHVVMYIGNGKFIEVQGSGGVNGATIIRSLGAYATSFAHIIRI